jgi:hypothetical protein
VNIRFQFATGRVKTEIYRIIILRSVLYGRESWSFALRERVFEKGVLRKIFGHKREEVTGERRRLHNEELCDLYSSPNIIG